jgi:hypothetical protein
VTGGGQPTHLDTDGTLSHLHVSERLLQVDLGGVTTGNHVAVAELHGLGTLGAHFALHNDLPTVSATSRQGCCRCCHLSTLSTVLHDVAENTVAGAANGKALLQRQVRKAAARKTCCVASRSTAGRGTDLHKLELEAFSLAACAEAAVADALGVELDLIGKEGVRARWGKARRGGRAATYSAFCEAETLLHERCELADAAAAGAEDFHSAGGPDDDFGPDGGLADLNTRKTVLSELLGQELAQLGVKDAVSDEPALLVDVVFSRHGGRHCFAFKGWRVKSLHRLAMCGGLFEGDETLMHELMLDGQMAGRMAVAAAAAERSLSCNKGCGVVRSLRGGVEEVGEEGGAAAAVAMHPQHSGLLLLVRDRAAVTGHKRAYPFLHRQTQPQTASFSVRKELKEGADPRNCLFFDM